MKSQMAEGGLVAERFKSVYDTKTTAQLLWRGYQEEVKFRHGEFHQTREIINNTWAMARTLTCDRPKWGIFLYGNYGTGKSTLLKAFARQLKWIDGSGEDYTKGGYIRIVDARDLAYMAACDRPAFQELCRTKMLGIEDLGKEPVEVMSYGTAYNPMKELLEKRYELMRFTIITTNMLAEDINGRYGYRISDRMKEGYETIGFEGDSFR